MSFAGRGKWGVPTLKVLVICYGWRIPVHALVKYAWATPGESTNYLQILHTCLCVDGVHGCGSPFVQRCVLHISALSKSKQNGKVVSDEVRGWGPAVGASANWGQHPLWWRHQMETFSALLAICAGNSPVAGEFPAQRPVTRSFDVFFDLLFNKRLSKQSQGWWFETPSCPLWCHRNAMTLSSLCFCSAEEVHVMHLCTWERVIEVLHIGVTRKYTLKRRPLAHV